MTIALIADLHGNMTAVEALERDLIKRKADAVWCLGDLVGKGPSSDRTFDWAVANCDLILRGNWDEGVGMKLFPNDAFYYDQLGKARLEKLCGFPLEHHARLSGRNIRLIHGRPIMKDLINPHQGSVPELEALFQDNFQVVGYADTHRQSLRTLSPGVFGILMSLEPAAAALAGIIVLGELLGPAQYAAVACVIAASVGATRSGQAVVVRD